MSRTDTLTGRLDPDDDRTRMRSVLRDARNGFVFGFAATIGAAVAIVVLSFLFRWLH